jgi:ATP-dependent RNA helicase DDX46/PRP5
MDEIMERTGVAVISRGEYIPPGKKLLAGERKLYLLLEGNTEMQVRQAKLEMVRVLEEETLRLGASAQTSFGRYSVV